jgi:LPS sulfotransferase NodH
LLASTGVAGRPESYFREPDLLDWAERFGVPTTEDGMVDYRGFVDRAVRHGTSPNGVFAARIMWGTLDSIVQGLNPSFGTRRDLEVLSDAFGPPLFVHLRRRDIVRQAVSWARAEQTGYWQQGDAACRQPHLDLDQIDNLVRTIREHNDAWAAWFAQEGVQPHALAYEDLVTDPRLAVRSILDHLGVVPPPDWQPEFSHVRQADQLNDEWVRRYESTR